MERFSDWLLNETFSFEYGPGAGPYHLRVDHSGRATEQPDHEKFKEFCRKAFIQYFGEQYKQATARYRFILKNVREGYSEVVLQFDLVPKGKSEDELAAPDHPMYQYYQQHTAGRTGALVFKTAKDAIESIPDDPGLVYRGMSWEEWQYIRRKGQIQSKGGYNIGQEGLTFYGNAATALYYASGFAPTPFITSIRRPSVVIAIPRKLVMDHGDLPDEIPGGDFAHRGPVDASNIAAAWMLSPTRAKIGSVELRFEWRRKEGERDFVPGPIKEGSRSSPSVSYVLRKLK